MILTDTHTHLHFPDYEKDFSETLSRAWENGVRYFVNVGTNLECSQKALRFAEPHENVFAAVGCHPHDSKSFRDAEYEEYRKLTRNPKVLAIGEVGLDFYRNLSPREAQEAVFRKFIALHKETELPLILHVRDAHTEIFQIMEQELGSSVRGVLHCFSGDESILEKALTLGLWISFACNITYKKNESLRRVVARVPNDKILLETDSPFLPPEGFRGRRNEPAYLVEGARLVAQIRGLSLEELARLTTENAAQFFGFPAGDQKAA